MGTGYGSKGAYARAKLNSMAFCSYNFISISVKNFCVFYIIKFELVEEEMYSFCMLDVIVGYWVTISIARCLSIPIS